MSDTSLPEWAQVLAVFDTETTGVATDTSRIVTAHISVINPENEIEAPRDWLLNCGIEIPEAASQIHGISTEYMQEHGVDAADGIFEIARTLQEFFNAGIPVVAYNAAFDFTILDRETKRYGFDPLDNPRPIIDPLILDRKLVKYRKGGRTLSDVTQAYGISLNDAHTASADAIAAGLIAKAMASDFSDQLKMSAFELHDMQVRWAAEQAADFAQWQKSKGRKVWPGDGVWPVR